MPMLKTDSTCLVLVDLQEKLWNVMDRREALADAASRLVRGVRVLGVEILHCEQNPAGLGRTIAPVARELPGRPIEKRSFSCCGEESFRDALESLAPRSVLLAGIETHVCVYQTAVDLRQRGLEVQVVADAVASRCGQNHAVGLERIRDAGASVTTVETCLFELLGRAEGEAFKKILHIVK
jgi:nicotinamidase-related amidase